MTLPRAGVLIAVATLSISAAARADESTESKMDFARGRELAQQGRCAEAIPKFRKAFELYPQGLGSLRNIATCEEQLGKFASARRDWWDLKGKAAAARDKKYAGWDKDADEAYHRLSSKVPRLRIKLRGKGYENASVAVNGEQLDRALLDDDVERDPGTYEIEVTGGEKPIKKSVTLEEGDNKTLTFNVSGDAAGGEETKSAARGDDKGATNDGSSTRTAGWVSIGFGVAFGVAAGVTFGIYESSAFKATNNCREAIAAMKPCDAQFQGPYQTAQVTRILAPVSLTLALAGVGLGATLIYTSSSQPKVRAFVSPLGGGAYGGLEARF